MSQQEGVRAEIDVYEQWRTGASRVDWVMRTVRHENGTPWVVYRGKRYEAENQGDGKYRITIRRV